MKHLKIKETYLIFLIVIGLASLALYSTYALFTANTEITDVVSFSTQLTTDSSILEYEMVTIPAGESKIIELNVTNSHTSTIYYGAWYQAVTSASDLNIGIYTEENNTPGTGSIAASSSKTILVGITNNGSSEAIVNVGVVGSESSNLNLADSRVLITGTWEVPSSADIIIENIKVDGSSSTTFPVGAYTVNANCTTANATFDYENWRFRVSSIGEDEICSPTFTSKDKVYLNDKVISLAGQTSGTGEVVNENGYRYEGKNPDNYIKFNNEMWRIIGVFDATSHGQTGLNLTKIIRNESIGGYVWDSNNINIWPNSSLYNLLNTYYYNASNGQDSGYCYQYSTTITGHCDYTNTGIQDYYRPMVKNVTWYLGGYLDTSITENFFNYERSTSNKNYYDSNYKTTTGYIGLMYPSDYGYSVLSSSCARTTNLVSYNTAACGGSSWLKKETYEWTLSHYSYGSDRVFYVLNAGYLSDYSANTGYATRPTLYLDSTVYIVGGTGTESDPYIIAMDS